ncbi:MAG: GMC family oxidoreductase N-terminal domain-containing protein [Anaerolineae bacterium]|nr:GMC family oxidoreductase N-terminal domain-containing protein [Anaerolineae bacterium]
MSADLFSQREIEVLTAVCDTFIPSLDVPPDVHGLYARTASDLNVPSHMAKAIEIVADAGNQAQLKMALDLLTQPLTNLVLSGHAKSFLDMTLEERTTTLRGWSESNIELRRKAFQACKRLALFYFYTLLDDTGCNPNWSAIHYPGPPPAAPLTEKPIKPLTLVDDITLDTDVVIVGSGAGGGVVAGALSAAGLDVIVLEKGGYYVESDFNGRELHSVEHLFENHGFLATNDLGVVILAGSTLGGGTTVNWSASLRPPANVLQEWEHDYGVTGFTGPDYQQALDAVSARINVNENECKLNEQNAVLERGGTALGYAVKTIPRNVKGCEDCGFCGFGCQFGAKQSTTRTFLQDAYRRGTRIAVKTHVERVLIETGQAVGVEAAVRAPDGRHIKLTVKARAVVVAAGSLHTPALLIRSGLTNMNIGRNLHLHPASVTYGMYDAAVNGWSGVIMSRYVTEFFNLDGKGYGVALETAPIHPGIAALTLPWTDGRQHKHVMERIAHMSNILIITRDKDGGHITVDKHGTPMLHYTLSHHDGAHLMRGVIESLRIHEAAGAHEISGPHSNPLIYTRGQAGSFDQYLKSTQAAGLRKNSFALFSAHQMSSCRMGGNPSRGAIDPTGETFEVRNLYVADGSALPTASGVNPMLTIMGVSHVIAQHIKARLR